MGKNIRVTIADDHALFRKGMISIIRDFPGIEVIEEAHNGIDLLEKIEINRPDVILLDLKMPEMDGMEANKIIQKQFPEVRIIVLSMYDDDKFIIHLIELGANGYLLKNAEPTEVENAIHAVMDTGFYFNNHVSKVMLKGLISKQKTKPTFENKVEFTARELEVLQLICKEHTNVEIANKLYLSTRTVDGYRNKLLMKTGAKNTAGIVMYAAKHGLVDM
jgi:DNA-binding NarL/FixJ family response regulator